MMEMDSPAAHMVPEEAPTEAQAPAEFVHLRVHSLYSLSEGAIHLKGLVEQTDEQGMRAVCVTDSMNLFGSFQFSQAAAEKGIQPVLGAILHLQPFSVRAGDILSGQIETTGGSGRLQTTEPLLLPILCKDEKGYRNLCQFLSRAYLDTEDQRIPWDWLQPENCTGLIALSGGLDGPLVYSLTSPKAGNKPQEQADAVLKKLADCFPDRFYIEIQRHDLDQQKQVEPALISLADQHELPLVATNDCFFLTPDMHDAHDALLCIAQGTRISDPNRRRVTKHHWFKPADEMARLFHDLPDAIENTVEIARRCHFFLEASPPILPPFTPPEGITQEDYLSKLVYERLDSYLSKLIERQKPTKEEVQDMQTRYQARMQTELDVINSAGFAGYFLIVADFIDWARQQNIPIGVGRGSGVASLVAFSMGITAIDPLVWDLMFERFLNLERISPPDFDVDFCPQRRDEVIAYVRERYGADRVAHIITFGTFQARAALRDCGRVLEVPYSVVDRLAKLVPFNPNDQKDLKKVLETDAQIRKVLEADEQLQTIYDTAVKIEGLCRHASTHAAGVVISDRPLRERAALYQDYRSALPSTQFNMKAAESVGLIKFDFLGLKTLTVLQDAKELVDARLDQTQPLDYDFLSFDDEKTIDIFRTANTHGIFQLESGGMRNWLQALKPDNIDDVVAIVALYRPGPMDSIPTYIARRWGREPVDYLHPKLKEVLGPTYGVLVYQEQIMKMSQILAGYTLGQADDMRSAMGKKNATKMAAHRIRFVEGALEHSNIQPDEAGVLFDKMAPFANYGFNKPHSVAYAIIAYRTAYIKANYPLEFYAAAMDQERKAGNTDAISGYFRDAKKNDVSILPPSVNYPVTRFAIEYDAEKLHGGQVRYCLGALKNVGDAPVQMIAECFAKDGAFKDIYDFLERIDPKLFNLRLFEIFIKAGAFDDLEPNRYLLLHNVKILYQHAQASAQDDNPGLFGIDLAQMNRPTLEPVTPWPLTLKLAAEAEAVGFYLTGHPMDAFSRELKRLDVLPSSVIGEDTLDLYTDFSLAGAVVSAKITSRTSEYKTGRRKGEKYTYRMANLTLSDTNGLYDIMLYDPTDQQIETILQPGELIFINAMLVPNKPASENAPKPPNSENPDNSDAGASEDSSAPKEGADTDSSSSGKRLRIKRVKSLAEAIAHSATGAHLELAQDDNVDWPALMRVLKTQTQEGTGRIRATVPTSPTNFLECELPGHYEILPGFADKMRDVRGVVAVEVL